MEVERMPFCCTSLVLGMFGDHGEESIVTVKEINRLLGRNQNIKYLDGEVVEEVHQRYVYASTVNPVNVAILKEAGFHEVDSYLGIQGRVHILTLHLGASRMQ